MTREACRKKNKKKSEILQSLLKRYKQASEHTSKQELSDSVMDNNNRKINYHIFNKTRNNPPPLPASSDGDELSGNV